MVKMCAMAKITIAVERGGHRVSLTSGEGNIPLDSLPDLNLPLALHSVAEYRNHGESIRLTLDTLAPRTA